MANAQAGRNLDILELTRLVVPIRQDQGGTGATTAKQGLTNLIVNADGVPFKDTDFSGTLKQDTLTANRTWTLPDETGTIALTSQTGFRNLIINGNFAINQRGYVSGTATTAANQYTLDRWYIEVIGNDVTFAASGNGNEITIGSGVNFGQVVAGENIFEDTYTLSWGGTATAKVNGTACDKGGQVTLAANTDAKIVFTNGTLSQVQLEPGSVATAFDQRPAAMELSLCERYFEQAIFQPDDNIGGAVSTYFKDGFHMYQNSVRFRVRKRAIPTFTPVSPHNAHTGAVAEYSVADGTFVSNRTASATNISVDGAEISVTGATAGAFAKWLWTADAEIDPS